MLDQQFILNTFRDNCMHVCLAPGDGLMLDKVGYDKYNENEERKKERVQIKLESQRQEVEEFR